MLFLSGNLNQPRSSPRRGGDLVEIAKIRFESPLEMVLAAGTAVGAGVLMFNRVVNAMANAHTKYQEARRDKARTDATVVYYDELSKDLRAPALPNLRVSFALEDIRAMEAVEGSPEDIPKDGPPSTGRELRIP